MKTSLGRSVSSGLSRNAMKSKNSPASGRRIDAERVLITVEVILVMIQLRTPTRRELPPDVMKIYTVVVIDGRADGLPILEGGATHWE